MGSEARVSSRARLAILVAAMLALATAGAAAPAASPAADAAPPAASPAADTAPPAASPAADTAPPAASPAADTMAPVASPAPRKAAKSSTVVEPGPEPDAREPSVPQGFGDLSFTSIDEPIVVEADKLEFDYDRNQLVYRGSVHVVQGEFELRSSNLIVTFERAGDPGDASLREVIAEGDVVITQGERIASGNVAIFDQKSRRVILLGDPVLRDGPNEVQGDRLTVYLDEGKGVIEAEPRKRVSAVLYPGQVGKEGEEPTSSPSAPTATPAAAGGVR